MSLAALFAVTMPDTNVAPSLVGAKAHLVHSHVADLVFLAALVAVLGAVALLRYAYVVRHEPPRPSPPT